jgi:hypothetical protein
MANIVYNYPKSSCQCYNCTHNKYTFPLKGTPSSLSVRDCDIPNYNECYDRHQFKDGIEPAQKSGYEYLNPQVAQRSFDPEFQKFKCDDSQCGTVYASTDPRLIDVPRSQVMPLDAPPYNNNVKIDEIYTDSRLNGYGTGYRTYSDINAGHISYYIDKSQEDAFFEPNFVSSAQTIGTLYRDPMGAMKPQYDRYPLKYDDLLNTDNTNYEGGLSWIRDSQSHRQDILAKQMRSENQRKWSARWVGEVQ